MVAFFLNDNINNLKNFCYYRDSRARTWFSAREIIKLLLIYKLMKKYIAEMLGTFGLTLAVSISLASLFPVSTPVIAALTLGLLVYSLGAISGTHINPAVTIGLWSLKKIATKDAVFYIVSQFLGAGLALWLVGSRRKWVPRKPSR